MVKYYLELLLIAEKDKIDEYVKYTEEDGRYNKIDTDICLDGSFWFAEKPEGYLFWEDIFFEANKVCDEQIKPCPFCGGEAEDGYYGEWRYVRCNDCGAKGKMFSVISYPEVALQRARLAWNKRS